MTWTCPNCKKKFKNTNQWHSCARVDPQGHFRNKPLLVRAIFDKLVGELGAFGRITVDSVKTSIQVRAASSFVSIKPKRDCLEIEFQLGHEADAFPVYRTIRVSKNRVLHFAVLEHPDDVDEQLVDWLRQAYELTNDTPKRK